MEGTTMVLVPEAWLNEISQKIGCILEQKQPAEEPEKIMTAEEAAEYLGINTNTVYTWARAGRIPVRRVGSKVFFSRAELEAWTKGDQK